MRENQASPGDCEEANDLRPAELTVTSGDPSATLPGSESSVFEPVANDLRSYPVGAGGEGLERIRIGGYQVERTLGAGGMGIVLLACDPSSQRRVAIKLIRREYLVDPSTVRAVSPRGAPYGPHVASQRCSCWRGL